MVSDSTGLRTFFASIDTFLADMIVKVYSLILSVADVNIVTFFESITEKIYSLIGLFVCFKAAIVIINYIIDPDKLTDKSTGTSKFLVRIVVSLALLGTMPRIFQELYHIQTIILQENVIGKFVLGQKAKDEKKEQEKDLDEIAKKVSYSIVTSFLGYNDTGSLSSVFGGCTNIFKNPDQPGLYFEAKKCNQTIRVSMCIDYLTGLGKDTSRFGEYGNNTSGYYYCKNTSAYNSGIKCGVRDGEYLINKINKARDDNDYKAVLSSEILSVTEYDPFFADIDKVCCSYTPGNIMETNDDDLILKCNKSDGDYVFKYNFGISTVSLLVTLVMFIILCVDVAIRVVKFAFLEIISPIPIISYIDVKESKLFNSWLKLTINTYLELFIKLFVIFLTAYFFSGKLEKVSYGNSLVLIFLIIGIVIFCIKCPDFISKMLGLTGDMGVMQLLKNTGKFFVGVGAIGVAGIGGNMANSLAAIPKIAESDNKGKEIIKGLGSGIAGGFGASARAAKNIIMNKGNLQKGTIGGAIGDSVRSRKSRSLGISKTDSVAEKTKEKENMEQQVLRQKNLINNQLSNSPDRNAIEEAFDVNYDNELIYKNYEDYKKAMDVQGRNSIEKTEYQIYENLYKDLRNFENELKTIEEQIEILNAREENKKNK